MKVKLNELTAKESAILSGSIASDKKATSINLFFVGEISSITDYIMICSGSSDRQVRAIVDGIVKAMKKLGARPLSIEGYAEGKWVLIDFNDLIVHVFYDEIRDYFRLDELWPEAEKLDLPKGYLKKYEGIIEING